MVQLVFLAMIFKFLLIYQNPSGIESGSFISIVINPIVINICLSVCVLAFSVNSPGKKPRISIDEEPDCSGFPIKSPVSYVNSSFVTSFSEHDVSEDKRVVPSPLSMCSGSPDRVTPSGEGEGRGNFVNHSPSPLQHGASILHPYPQRHSTIQVT